MCAQDVCPDGTIRHRAPTTIIPIPVYESPCVVCAGEVYGGSGSRGGARRVAAASPTAKTPRRRYRYRASRLGAPRGATGTPGSGSPRTAPVPPTRDTARRAPPPAARAWARERPAGRVGGRNVGLPTAVTLAPRRVDSERHTRAETERNGKAAPLARATAPQPRL